MSTAPAPTLRQILYLSRNTNSLNAQDIRQILAQAQMTNRKHDITGALAYTGVHFVQVLEGWAADVQPLVARIASDPRHKNMRVIDDHAITTRLFSRWSMGYLHNPSWSDRVEALLIAPELDESHLADGRALVMELTEALLM